jgi:pyruvate dehydrogenase E2 component (dihydrolipoamide acetyltransferase)
MIRKVKLAKINLTMQTGTIVRWLKKEGERVEQDEPLLEVETDKAVNTVESFHAGYLKKILVAAGREVPVDTLIAYIGEKDDEVPAEPPLEARPSGVPASGAQAPAGAAAEAAHAAVASAAAGQPPAAHRGPLNASPLARRLAAELGVDLSQVTGSGPEGRISKEDVLAAAQRAGASQGAGAAQPGAAQPGAAEAALQPGGSSGAPPGSRELPLSGLKKLTGERMKASYLEAPHIYLEVSVRVGALEALRVRLNAEGGAQRYTLSDLLVRAVSLALRENPLLNAAWRGGRILAFDEQGIGLAVAGAAEGGLRSGGLVVPVIRGCQSLSLRQIRERRGELVARARQGRQTAEDLSGGTFTITNLGMFGVDAFRPILYPGQAAILAVGAVRLQAVVDEAGAVSAQPVLQLTLGCDHRIVDGAEGARFLQRLKQLLEQPEALAE